MRHVRHLVAVLVLTTIGASASVSGAKVAGFAWQAPVTGGATGPMTVAPSLGFTSDQTVTTSGYVRIQAKDDFRWSNIAEYTIPRTTHHGSAQRIVVGHRFTFPAGRLCDEPAVRAEGTFSATGARHHSVLPTAYRHTQVTDITATVKALCGGASG